MAFAFNLRFPGQYYDAETGLHYNYHRDFDPSLGRYLKSDPIGLAGGINTYGYVRGMPLTHADRLGLDSSVSFGGGAWGQAFALGGGMDGGVAIGSNGNVCVYSNRCNSLGWNGPFGGSAGGVVQLSKGKLCSGDQESFGIYFFGGSGLGGEGQFQMSSGGPQLGRGIGPLSYGVGAGVIHCKTTYVCFRDQEAGCIGCPK